MITLDKIQQNKTLKPALASGGLIIGLILVYLFVGKPIFAYNDKLRAEFKAAQDKLLESEGLIRSFPNPQKEMGELEKKAQELRDMGATTKQLPRLIQSLALPANNLAINVTTIRPREEMKVDSENLPAGVTKIYIEVAMNCPYQLFAQYTKAISELPTTFIIERLAIEKKGEDSTKLEAKKAAERTGEKTEELSINLLLSTYMILEI